nr:MAG TPA: hypothetical protein [Inoviridae sp.]
MELIYSSKFAKKLFNSLRNNDIFSTYFRAASLLVGASPFFFLIHCN